ncbi:MAG TPA: hypothetical protein VJQ52_08380 [Steroidobacteraceae bacterium]|nr:hypothetical protein [Steroidobacteraceae bacterium]
MHWTYEEFLPESDLEQGDILACTPAVRDILADVHPHFCAPKYLGFTVATQSCDLVRRPELKARYITIATIRSLRDVLPDLLALINKPVARNIFQASGWNEAQRFLARLFDQNEQAQGLFYLHPDGAVGLGEPCVSFLRVTVTLRAEHYATLVAARRGRLKSDFRSKYGWLIGNLYSRAAAPDWSDAEGGKTEVAALIKGNLKRIDGYGPLWIDDDLVTTGLKAGVVFAGREDEELLAELEQHREKPPIERLAAEVIKQAKKIFSAEEDAESLKKLENRLLNSGIIKKLVQ